MNEKEHLQTLSEIKTLMERSSRFLSLSGSSGIFVGLYALIGAAVAWWYCGHNEFRTTSYYNLATASNPEAYKGFLPFFMWDALIVLVASLLTAYAFTFRLAKRQGSIIWDTSARRLLIHLLLPLGAGGIYCLILLQHHLFGLVAPSLLVFYGLAMLNAGKYTYESIRYLGIIQIILGLIAMMDIGYGLEIWALGFGVVHIIYGVAMYYKYEK